MTSQPQVLAPQPSPQSHPPSIKPYPHPSAKTLTGANELVLTASKPMPVTAETVGDPTLAPAALFLTTSRFLNDFQPSTPIDLAQLAR